MIYSRFRSLYSIDNNRALQVFRAWWFALPKERSFKMTSSQFPPLLALLTIPILLSPSMPVKTV